MAIDSARERANVLAVGSSGAIRAGLVPDAAISEQDRAHLALVYGGDFDFPAPGGSTVPVFWHHLHTLAGA